jgi:glucokinase
MTAAIGIDVGGTVIKGGVVSASGEVLAKATRPTNANAGPAQVVERIAALIATLQSESDGSFAPTSVGLGVPGNIDHGNGVVLASPNLNGWNGVPVARLVSEGVGLPVVLDNDANCAALGEALCGIGRGADSMVLLTLGTGVGSGMVLGGKVWRGTTGLAGELGHSIVHVGGRSCACGQSGCLEAYASASSTVRRALELIESGEASSLREVLDRGQAITAEMIVQAAEDGDRLAGRVWEETCRYLAAAGINIQHLVEPQYIVLAGGMSAAGERLRRPVQGAIDAMVSRRFGQPPRVRLSLLGNDAGFIGAAMNALQVDR